PQPNLAGFSITRHHTLTALDITRRDATTNRSSSCKRRNGARRAAVLECARVNIEEATSTRVARRNDGRVSDEDSARHALKRCRSVADRNVAVCYCPSAAREQQIATGACTGVCVAAPQRQQSAFVRTRAATVRRIDRERCQGPSSADRAGAERDRVRVQAEIVVSAVGYEIAVHESDGRYTIDLKIVLN